MRIGQLLLLMLISGPTLPLAAQGSQFGIRGLGFPGRSLDARTTGAGGAPAMFAGEAARNPAALTFLSTTTISFNTASSWVKGSNPVADNSTRSTRFPLLSLAGRIPGTRLFLGVNQSLYTDRDFTAVTRGVAVPREDAILYTDSLRSRGGINDLRLQAAFHLSPVLAVGAGVDFLTGQNQMTQRRSWADTVYQGIQTSGEVSFESVGATAGLVFQPHPRLQVAGTAQILGDLRLEQDSLGSDLKVPMPLSISGAARLMVTPSLRLSGMVTLRDWNRANRVMAGTDGWQAQRTREFAAGVEWLRNSADPDHLPLRLGVRKGSLPFPAEVGGNPEEWALSLGTGARFANQTGGIDLALERVSRSESGGYSERAWQLTMGVTIRSPGGN